MNDLSAAREAVRHNFIGIAVALGILYPISLFLVGARVWVRRTITQNLSWEDFVLVAAEVTMITTGGIFLTIIYVVGWDKPYPERPELYTLYVVGIAFYVTAGILVKFAITGFFLRVARIRWQRWAATIPLCIYILTMVPLLLVLMLRCGVPATATDMLARVDCPISAVSFKALGMISAIINMISDWLYAAIPAHMFYTAPKMDRHTRWSAVVVMLLATIASVVSVIRIPTFNDAKFGPNFLYDYSLLSFLSLLETCIGIIAISMVTLKPLLNAIVAKTQTFTASHLQPRSSRKPGNPSQGQGAGAGGTTRSWIWGASARRSRQRPGKLGVLPDTTFASVMGTINVGTMRDPERDAMDAALPAWPMPPLTSKNHSLGTLTEIGPEEPRGNGEDGSGGVVGGFDEPDVKMLETLKLAVGILPGK